MKTPGLAFLEGPQRNLRAIDAFDPVELEKKTRLFRRMFVVQDRHRICNRRPSNRALGNHHASVDANIGRRHQPHEVAGLGLRNAAWRRHQWVRPDRFPCHFLREAQLKRRSVTCGMWKTSKGMALAAATAIFISMA